MDKACKETGKERQQNASGKIQPGKPAAAAYIVQAANCGRELRYKYNDIKDELMDRVGVIYLDSGDYIEVKS